MTDENDIQKIVHDIASELIQVVNKEHSMLLSEISRMKEIVNEASGNLHRSFNGMDSDNRMLRLELQKLREGITEKSDKKEECDSLHTGQSMKVGIRALQFEDIIQQMLNHARHRIYSIERLFSTLEQIVDNFDDNADPGKIRSVLLECHAEIQNTRKLLELENPVNLDSLTKNDVTLF